MRGNTVKLVRLLLVGAFICGACDSGSPTHAPSGAVARVAPAEPPPPPEPRSVTSFGELNIQLRARVGKCTIEQELGRWCMVLSDDSQRYQDGPPTWSSAIKPLAGHFSLTDPGFEVIDTHVPSPITRSQSAYFISDPRLPMLIGAFFGTAIELGTNIDGKAVEAKFNSLYGPEVAVQATVDAVGVKLMGREVRICDGELCHKGLASITWGRPNVIWLVDLDTIAQVRSTLGALSKAEKARETNDVLGGLK